MGLEPIGGSLYRINDDGSRDLFSSRNGQMGFWVDESFMTYDVGYIDGQAQLMQVFGVQTTFMPLQNTGSSGLGWLDYVQGGLDVVGLVPGIGEIADGANALIYLGRGDYTNAGLSAAAMIPFAGAAFTGTKIANKAIRYSKLADKAHGTAATFNKTTSINTKIMFNDLTQGLPKQVIQTPKGPIIRANLGNGRFLQRRGFDRSGSHTTFDWIDSRSLVYEWKFNP